MTTFQPEQGDNAAMFPDPNKQPEMSRADMLKQLQALDEGFDEVEAAKGRVSVPDGTYQVRIQSLNVSPSKKDPSSLRALMRLFVLGPRSRGGVLYQSYNLTPESLPYLKRDLIALGVSMKPSQLVDQGHTLVGIVANITKKDNKEGYANVYIASAAGRMAQDPEEGDASFDPASFSGGPGAPTNSTATDAEEKARLQAFFDGGMQVNPEPSAPAPSADRF